MTSEHETLLAEIEALKLLVLSAVAQQDNRESVIERFEARTRELETHALYETILSDSLRNQIVSLSALYVRQIRKWADRPSPEGSD